MSSRRKRKKPLPDWLGESYSSSNKNGDEEETTTGQPPAKQKDLSQSAGASSPQHTPGGWISHKTYHPYLLDTGNRLPYRRTKPSDKSTREEPMSAEEIIRLSLPLLKFDGSLVYCYNRSECSVLCEELMSRLSAEDVWHVGLDMEWPVEYRPGAPNKVALIQLCTQEDKCYLFHIAPMGTLPKALKDLLSHGQVIKYGINIEADFWKLERDFDIQVREIIRDSVTDLGNLANAKLKSTERWTLDGLTRNVLRKRLNKEQTVRCGRWDTYPLSEEQLRYAAADAYASFLLANHLKDK